MKFSISLSFILSLLVFSGCGNMKKLANPTNGSDYSIRFISQAENTYEGNLIVEVFDSKGKELKNAHLQIASKDEKISDLDLDDTSTGVFSNEESSLTVKVVRAGYTEAITESFTIEKGKACFIEFRLAKK